MNGADRRQSILNAAAELFSAKGYARTSMEDIASVVGIKKASLYYFYDSKDALLFDIFQCAISVPEDRFDRILADGASNVEKLRRLITILVESYNDALPLMVSFTRISLDTIEDPKRRAELEGMRRRVEVKWENVIAAGIAAGEFRGDLDRKLVTFGIIGMINWMYKWYSPQGRALPSEIARTFSSMILEGLTRPSLARTGRRGARVRP